MSTWAQVKGKSFAIKVLLISCIKSAPITVPTTLTLPPLRGVPPTTTAVIAESSIRRPMLEGSLAPRRAVATTPARAARSPADNVHREERPAHRMSRQIARRAVAPDGYHVPAERGAPYQETHYEDRHDRHDNRCRYAEEATLSEPQDHRIGDPQRLAPGEDLGQSPTTHEHGKRGDDGLHPDEGHETVRSPAQPERPRGGPPTARPASRTRGTAAETPKRGP